MHVERPPPFVSLGDAGVLQVAVEDFDQSGRNVEDEGISRQSGRDRLPSSEEFRLEHGELVVEPVPQTVRQVVTDDDAVAFPVLLIGRVVISDN